MANLLVGSICLTDLNEQAKNGHSAFSRGKNGKVYFNVNLWVNDTPDQYGNTVSIQLNSKKELRETEGKIYIGNAKPLTPPTPTQKETPSEFDDNFPL
jgi:hypothetical protein